MPIFKVQAQPTRRLDPITTEGFQARSLLSLLNWFEEPEWVYSACVVNAVWEDGKLIYSEFRPDTWPEGWKPRNIRPKGTSTEPTRDPRAGP